MTLIEAKKLFVDFLTKEGKSPSTITAYNKDIEQMNSYLLSIEKIEKPINVKLENLNNYIEYLKSGKGGSFTLKTISRKINSMKTFFKYLSANMVTKVNPSVDVKHPKYELSEPRILAKLEYRALRDSARYNTRLYTIIEILLQTGIRIGELSRIRLEDIRNEKKKTLLYIREFASNNARSIELNEAANIAIKNYLQSRHSPNDGIGALFTTKNGNGLLVRNIRSSVGRALEKAGIKGATVNDIRNTFIVHQLKNGMSIEMLSEIVGHKRLSSTKKYIELVDVKPKRKMTKIAVL